MCSTNDSALTYCSSFLKEHGVKGCWCVSNLFWAVISILDLGRGNRNKVLLNPNRRRVLPVFTAKPFRTQTQQGKHIPVRTSQQRYLMHLVVPQLLKVNTDQQPVVCQPTEHGINTLIVTRTTENAHMHITLLPPSKRSLCCSCLT